VCSFRDRFKPMSNSNFLFQCSACSRSFSLRTMPVMPLTAQLEPATRPLSVPPRMEPATGTVLLTLVSAAQVSKFIFAFLPIDCQSTLGHYTYCIRSLRKVRIDIYIFWVFCFSCFHFDFKSTYTTDQQ
jgi:hypothetical protein